MYYPYLRGKQFELIALREFSKEIPTPSFICPIIEPVKNSFNSLNSVIESLSSKDIRFALVMNPCNGDFKRVGNIEITKNLPILDDIKGKWIPAFLYSEDSASVEEYLSKHTLNDIMLVFPNSIDFSRDDISMYQLSLYANIAN